MDKNAVKELLQKRFTDLENTPAPRGYRRACEELNLRIFMFDGYVAGLASSCLKGAEIDPNTIKLGDDLARQLDECQARLDQLKAYYQKVSELAQTVHDYCSY